MFGESRPLAHLTRDDPRYWDCKPRDHNGAGLFIHGPQEERPAWPRDVKTGNAHRTDEPRAVAIGRMRSERVRRLQRLARAAQGEFTGYNRRTRRNFAHRWKD